jgi:2-polyprenyl-3-methyl-5-hydroxy-6-metoxy-1,4-benzoquinol methylase
MRKEHSQCLICSSTTFMQVALFSTHGLVKCSSCSFVFSKWIPDNDELIKHYGTYTRTDGISEITIKRYKELAHAFEKYRNTGNWIDVGCGNGHLLSTVAKSGWKVYGTEFTDTAVQICNSKGISMQEGKLNLDNYKAGSFDIVSSIEVIEHINNLHEEIDNFRTLLRKGGLLYITTPNYNSISRHLLKSQWSIVEYPEHLCYFTPSSLHQLLTMHGFKRLKCETTGISIARLKKTNTADASIKARESEELLRVKAENNPLISFAKSAVNTFLNLSGKGEALKVQYIRS